MTKYNKDTLVNLISCELQRLAMLKQQSEQNGRAQAVDYWAKEIKDLEELNSVIWNEIK